MKTCLVTALTSIALLAAAATTPAAQTVPDKAKLQAPAQAAALGVTPPPVTPPPDYVIGPDDLLSVVFWRDKEMSSDVAVRPDGKISLPLLNDVQAAGLTPPQLRDRLTEEAKNYIEDPNVTVVIRQINSRKVFVTGQVNKPGTYPLGGPTTVLQLIAMAGGLPEYAHTKKIRVMRTENGKTVSLKFNYDEVVEGKNLKQNIELKPGDTVIVP